MHLNSGRGDGLRGVSAIIRIGAPSTGLVVATAVTVALEDHSAAPGPPDVSIGRKNMAFPDPVPSCLAGEGQNHLPGLSGICLDGEREGLIPDCVLAAFNLPSNGIDLTKIPCVLMRIFRHCGILGRP
jgi:hypothetical protein